MAQPFLFDVPETVQSRYRATGSTATFSGLVLSIEPSSTPKGRFLPDNPLNLLESSVHTIWPVAVHVLPEPQILPEAYLQPQTIEVNYGPLRTLPEEEYLDSDRGLEIPKSDDHSVPSVRSFCFPPSI
ncbi:hypothetical protein RHMOL_Rhmol04G0224300 [Rhododendron molle]|uniref:Uncharacterized protein n=1 Tax=Rhododendron molle TaxID=49168 RepID=A0ACC0P4G5_RHOML|nr:hypothetical protein RHMOL_Rhmol04G0224300 [Rhododendron molle]